MVPPSSLRGSDKVCEARLAAPEKKETKRMEVREFGKDYVAN